MSLVKTCNKRVMVQKRSVVRLKLNFIQQIIKYSIILSYRTKGPKILKGIFEWCKVLLSSEDRFGTVV